MKSETQRVKSRLFGEHVIGDVSYPDQALAVDNDEKGNIRLNFARPLTWFVLSPEEAIVFAKTIAARAGATRIEIE